MDLTTLIIVVLAAVVTLGIIEVWRRHREGDAFVESMRLAVGAAPASPASPSSVPAPGWRDALRRAA